MAPASIRKCSKEKCPPDNISSDSIWHCFSCQHLIHLVCYEVMNKPEEVFFIDNIVMVCDECLANRSENPSPKRKVPNSSGNLIQTTLDVLNPTLSITKTTMAASTPSKSKEGHQLQSVVESLVQKVDYQTKTIVTLQTSIESMKGAVNEQTTAIGESSKVNGETFSSIKESLNEMTAVTGKFSYADMAKVGVRNVRENGTPKSSRTPKSAHTPRSNKPIITGTSTKLIGKPISPIRPKPEKAVWISGIHRDATENEIIEYIRDSIGIASTDVDVRKLVKKGRDITEYRFVSFRIGCSLANFNKLMNPMYWPSNSRIREFDFEGGSSTFVRFNKSSHPIGLRNPSDQSKNSGTSSTAQMEE